MKKLWNTKLFLDLGSRFGVVDIHIGLWSPIWYLRYVSLPIPSVGPHWFALKNFLQSVRKIPEKRRFGSRSAHVRNFQHFHDNAVYYPHIYMFAMETAEIFCAHLELWWFQISHTRPGAANARNFLRIHLPLCLDFRNDFIIEFWKFSTEWMKWLPVLIFLGLRFPVRGCW